MLSSPSSPYFWCGGCCGYTFCDFNSSSEISHSWYDFTVKADGSNQEANEEANQEARYAGRVETGMPGFSDPLMGGVLRAT
jgi:hypothetical protein